MARPILERYGTETILLDWRERLVCSRSRGGGLEVYMVVTRIERRRARRCK